MKTSVLTAAMRPFYTLAIAVMSTAFSLSSPAQANPIPSMSSSSATADSPAAFTANPLTEPQTTLSLEQATALASQYQPLQHLWQGRHQLALANLQQSGLRSNPELMLSQTGLQQNNERELDIGIAQHLDLFGVRRARQQLASIALDSENIRQLAYQAQLKLAVTAAYWRVVQAEWLVRLEQDQADLSGNSEQVAKKRLNAGRIAEVEYSRVLVAHQQVLSQLAIAQTSLTEARFQLSRLWGNRQPVFSTMVDSSRQGSGWPVLDKTLLNATLHDNPQQQLLQQQVQQAQARLVLAQAQAKPQPTLSLGLNQTRMPSVQNSIDNRLTLGLSVPMPIFNRNQGVIKATQALSRISADQQRYLSVRRAEQIQAGLIKLDGLQLQYQQLQQHQLPLAKSIQQKTVQGFEAGKFSVTEVQQATRDYQALQFNQLQTLTQAWQLALQLQAVSLGLDSELDGGFEMNNANYLDNRQSQLWQDAQALPIIGTGE